MFNFFKKRNDETRSVIEIMEKYEAGQDPVTTTHAFVKEFLNPYAGRFDMTYRYEHTLRTALWGKKIAEGEGWESEPLVMACLLHDVGYPKCTDFNDFKVHPSISAEITKKFLEKIQYDEERSKSICKAVAIHDRWNDVPADATPFELSVRDADDLDRFGVMRMCMLARDDIGERSASELLELCDKRLSALEGDKERICGTPTAKKLWDEELAVRKQFYEDLKKQVQGTFEMEKWLKER